MNYKVRSFCKLGQRIHLILEKPKFIRADWDEVSEVWVATSDDVPGLATEADTMENLVAKLKMMIPELLLANGYSDITRIPFEIFTRRFEIVDASTC